MLMQALLVAGFVLVHLAAGKLKFLDVIPRSRWLSLAGGLSVAYVFIHIFPELVEAQEVIRSDWLPERSMDRLAFLVALAGLGTFYGLERLVKKARPAPRPERKGGETGVPAGVFWLHIGSFAVYNALIGYLLVHREEPSVSGLLLFWLAMALHFLVNDYGLSQDHREEYRRLGRWALAAAIVGGWILGLGTSVSRETVGILFAFLAGGVILNVLKEELPEERESRFIPFALGAVGYALLLLLLG